jgi:hypothetical protein
VKTTPVPLRREGESGDELFASTHWTIVLEAGDSATTSACAARSQGFFAHLIESRAYAHAVREKGRFRDACHA